MSETECSSGKCSLQDVGWLNQKSQLQVTSLSIGTYILCLNKPKYWYAKIILAHITFYFSEPCCNIQEGLVNYSFPLHANWGITVSKFGMHQDLKTNSNQISKSNISNFIKNPIVLQFLSCDSVQSLHYLMCMYINVYINVHDMPRREKELHELYQLVYKYLYLPDSWRDNRGVCRLTINNPSWLGLPWVKKKNECKNACTSYFYYKNVSFCAYLLYKLFTFK